MLVADRPHRLTVRLRALLFVLVGALCLTSCKVDVRLGVHVDADGSGRVVARFVVDSDAVKALGGDLEQRLKVADLIQAGWKVDTRPRSDGGATVTASKSFGTAAELGDVIQELSGSNGPFRDFTLHSSRSVFRGTYRLSGTVDLRGGAGASAVDPHDEGLTAPLRAQGVDVEALQRALSERIDRAISFQVVVDLPGDEVGNAPVESGGAAVWSPHLGERVGLETHSARLDWGRIGLLALAAVSALLAVGVFFGLHRRRGRRGEDANVSEPSGA